MTTLINSKSNEYLIPIPSVVYKIFTDSVNRDTNSLTNLLDSLSSIEVRALSLATRHQGIINLGNTISLVDFINKQKDDANIPVYIDNKLPSGNLAPFRTEYRMLCQYAKPQDYKKPVELVKLFPDKSDDLVDVWGLVLYNQSLDLSADEIVLAVVNELLEKQVAPTTISKILKANLLTAGKMLANQ